MRQSYPSPRRGPIAISGSGRISPAAISLARHASPAHFVPTWSGGICATIDQTNGPMPVISTMPNDEQTTTDLAVVVCSSGRVMSTARWFRFARSISMVPVKSRGGDAGRYSMARMGCAMSEFGGLLTKWLAWSMLLVIQNASFTWVSRARNSGSLGYHAVAAVFSNGVWFASQFILIGVVVKELKTIPAIVGAATLYVASTVIGSVAMYWVSMRYLERGKRSVGKH